LETHQQFIKKKKVLRELVRKTIHHFRTMHFLHAEFYDTSYWSAACMLIS